MRKYRLNTFLHTVEKSAETSSLRKRLPKACKILVINSIGRYQDNFQDKQTPQENDAFSIQKYKAFSKDERGMSTLASALCILLVLVLVVSSTQIQWLQSESVDIQFVADAAALSAENVVAEFYVIARVVDAITLSMSLLSLSVLAVATVASLVPPAWEVAGKLAEFGFKVRDARDKFISSAEKALNTYQKIMPLLCAYNSTMVVSQNSSLSTTSSYVGFAIPFPLESEDADLGDDGDGQEALDEMNEDNEEAQKQAEIAKEAKDKMDEAKTKAYMADCGNNPDYCMYQRAKTLASMSGSSNPYYESVDLWNFSVALDRAKAYYSNRLNNESPEDSSVKESVRSTCRKVFYKYAVEKMKEGYVNETETTFDANFPLLPKNTTEMKSTHIYTDSIWPVSNDSVIHGCSDCPHLLEQGQMSLGSLSQYDQGIYTRCDTCEFTIGDMGKVGAASSNIDNGFEYYYRIVAEEADEYQKQKEIADEAEEKAKSAAEDSFETFKEALQKLGSKRYNPEPPGKNGCIAVVVDTSSHSAPAQFVSSLLGSEAEIGPRIAISAAALANDDPEEGKTIISSLFDEVVENSEGITEMAGDGLSWIVGVWSSMLEFYSNSVSSLEDGVEKALGSIELEDGGTLGAWAKKALSSTIDSLGLSPVELSTPKPAVVNTIHVLNNQSSSLAQAMTLARALNGIGEESSITIEMPFGSDLTIDLPDGFSSVMSFVMQAATYAQGYL